MIRLKVLSFVFAVLFSAKTLGATTVPAGDQSLTVAVDAKGRSHTASEYGRRWPWMYDYAVGSTMNYPDTERRLHHQGTAVLNVAIDPGTGRVANIRVIRSSGFPALDDSAVKGIAQRRWQPETWKEIVVPVTFKLPSPPLAPGPTNYDVGRRTGALQPRSRRVPF